MRWVFLVKGEWAVHSFCVNYLFQEVRKSRVKESGIHRRDFWLNSILIQLHTHEVFFFFSLWFWWKHNIKDQTQWVSPLILWLNMLHSVCLNLCTFSSTFSPAPLSLPFVSSYNKFSLVSFFTIWPLYSGRVQSHSSTTAVVKWIMLVFEVNPSKRSLREIFLASSLPLLLRHSPCPIWSHLEPERRGETVWRWGDANNVALHLMCLKCLWAVRLALWSATNLMVSQVHGDLEQTGRRKKHCHIEGWGDTLWSLKRPEQQKKESIWSCVMFWKSFQLL